MCLLDEPATTLTIQTEGQAITARDYGQVALDLGALPRGAAICATLHDTWLEYAQLVAFTVIIWPAAILSEMHIATPTKTSQILKSERSGQHHPELPH